MSIRPTTLAAAAIAASAGLAHAHFINATITADNHYALYSGTGPLLTFHGRNEVGASGSPGQFNWSRAETFTNLDVGDDLYIAAWSDDRTAQGLLAQIQIIGGDTRHSGDPRWEVFATGLDLDSGSPAPTTTQLAAQIAIANAGNLWETPFVGGTNGIAPWGTIAGIGSSIRWMWRGNDSPNTLTPGGNHGEYLIFRMTVPTPGAAATFALAGLALARRRRA